MEYESTEDNADDGYVEDGDDEETSGNGDVQHAVEYRPSERLAVAESELPAKKKAFVKDGRVKVTMKNAFVDSMNTGTAADGLRSADREWRLMLEGPEAGRLIDTFGNNFATFVASPNGAEMANAVASTVHTLLARAGAETRHAGLVDVATMTTSLFRSPLMPEIVNLAGGLILSAVNKNQALASVHQFWVETDRLLKTDNLNAKVNTLFENLTTAMASMAKKNPIADNRAQARNQ